MTTKYNRTWEIIFGFPVRDKERYVQEGSVEDVEPPVTGTSEDAKVVPEKNISFTTLPFNFSTSKGNNKGNASESTSLTIRNMSPESVKYISREGIKVIIYAGYNGDNSLIYTGDVISVEEVKNQPGTTVNISCKESYITVKNSRVSLNYNSALSKHDIVVDLINKLDGVTVGSLAIDQLKDQYPLNGFSVHGKTHKELSKLSERWGFDFTINKGVLTATMSQVVNGDATYEKRTVKAYRLTPDLIKTIGKLKDSNAKLSAQKDTKSGVKVSTFLTNIPEGVFIVIEDCDGYNGTYKTTTHSYSLQSEGRMWDLLIELQLV